MVKNNKDKDKKNENKDKKNEDDENDGKKNNGDNNNKNNDDENNDGENNDENNDNIITSVIFIINKKQDENNENNENDYNENDYYDDYDDYYDDNYDDNYYNDLNNKKEEEEEKKKEEENKKRKKELNDNMNEIDSFFNKIIKKVTKKNKKQKKNDEIDDFKNYFKESDKLLPLNVEIKTLNDLIILGKTYNPDDKNRYVINLRALNKCVEPLIELDNMIGMKNIKEMIIDLIFFRLQNLEDDKDELWHLVIQGSPGSGKTEVAKIIGKLYYSLGIIKKDKFTLAKRSDLIGKYLGHTAKITQEVFDNAKGGVLFIDEAYSLGNPEQRDSFSKECIDTINQNLTENKETVVFIAGYKDQLNESFFSYNPGLNRRFKMRMTVDKYNASDLREIYIKKIRENRWNVLNDDLIKEIPLFFFEKNIDTFKYNGGDMENLWHFTKIVHSRRIFGKSQDLIKKITHIDLDNAYKLYSDNDEVKSRIDDNISKYILNSMYV